MNKKYRGVELPKTLFIITHMYTLAVKETTIPL